MKFFEIRSDYLKICGAFCSIMDKNYPTPRTPLSRVPVSLVAGTISRVGDLGYMFFLLRMAFWLSVVLILLPTGSGQSTPPSEVGASDAISAASATVNDLRGFCTREPHACTVGSQVATTLGYKAQAGAKMLYEFLTAALAPHETGSIAGSPVRRGIVSSTPDKSSMQRASQNTLTPTDLSPAWRGPAGRKDPKHSA
jgi:hypothetical protein